MIKNEYENHIYKNDEKKLLKFISVHIYLTKYCLLVTSETATSLNLPYIGLYTKYGEYFVVLRATVLK